MSSTPAPSQTQPFNFFDPATDWQTRLAFIVDTMREMSEQTDPQTTVRLGVFDADNKSAGDRWLLRKLALH